MCPAKTELFHLCAEVNVTNGPTPKLEDVIATVLEDVSVIGGLSSMGPSATSSRRRSLHAASAHPLQNRRRALKKSMPPKSDLGKMLAGRSEIEL